MKYEENEIQLTQTLLKIFHFNINSIVLTFPLKSNFYLISYKCIETFRFRSKIMICIGMKVLENEILEPKTQKYKEKFRFLLLKRLFVYYFQKSFTISNTFKLKLFVSQKVVCAFANSR